MTDQSNYPPPPVQPTAPFEPGYPPAAPPLTQQPLPQQPLPQQPLTQQPLPQQPLTQQPLPQQPVSAQPPPPPISGVDAKGHVKGGRVSAVWIGVIIAAVLLIALLDFIAQNSRRVPIHFLGWHAHASLAIALVLAAIIGVLLVAIPATARIVQLRIALKRNAREAREVTKAGRPD